MGQKDRFPFDEVCELLADRFKVEQIIRAGGQGVVSRAIRIMSKDGLKVHDAVALKFYFDPTQDERVDREIRALEGFRHPNLANLIDHGRIEIHEKTVRYVAWEFIEGEALDHRLGRGPLAPKLVACVGRDASRAIGHIWKKRIVHRDVSPKNIMVRSGENEAVLIDLGIARHLSETPLTTAGVTWGTIGYMSPEQYRAEKQLTCYSDVFSLGIVLQEALCAQHPTRGDQERILTHPCRTAQIAPTAPAGIADLVDTMLRPRAAFRPHPDNLANRFAELAAQL